MFTSCLYWCCGLVHVPQDQFSHALALHTCDGLGFDLTSPARLSRSCFRLEYVKAVFFVTGSS